MTNSNVPCLSSRQKGDHGEEQAVLLLKNKGYTLLARQYATRWGEIDIIAQKKDLIIFVEVKARAQAYSSLLELVTFKKQQRLIKTAYQFIQEHERKTEKSFSYRFDVVTVCGSAPFFNHIEQAFVPSHL